MGIDSIIIVVIIVMLIGVFAMILGFSSMRDMVKVRYRETRAVYPALFQEVETNISDIKTELRGYSHGKKR